MTTRRAALRRRLQPLWPWLRWGTAATLALLLVLDFAFPPPLPKQRDTSTLVVAADGTPLRAFADAEGVWRYPASTDSVSPLYLQALLTYEDRWFWRHPGINPLAILRASGQLLRGGRIVSGGSTLTMQVARILDPHTRTPWGKLKQMLRAVQLEVHLSKQQILALYLERAPYGGTIEGVEAASWAYLGKPAAQLSHAEAALLAVLPQAPSRLRPDRHPEAAQKARDKVLSRMAELGAWTAEEVEDARIENVVARSLRPPLHAALLAQRLHSAHPGQARIQSSIDIGLQRTLEERVASYFSTLPERTSAALLVVDNQTLQARAYVGTLAFGDRQRLGHVDMVQAWRSPGSTLKPFLYAMALDDGLIHSESLLIDAPMSFGGYAPGNFQAAFAGPISVAQALQRSLNVPAVDLLDRVGPASFASVMLTGGVKLRMPAGAEPNLSLILGGGGTTLEELVGAYRALARDGISGRPRLTAEQPVVESRMMSPGAAWIVRDILEGGGHPDRPFYQSGNPGRQLAWKTGTSFGFRDAWAVGVTDRWTIGVWVGRPDGTPNPGFFGANVAAPLLQDIVAALPEGAQQVRVRPETVQAVVTCWPLGYRLGSEPSGACPEQRAAWMLNETAPPSFAGYADATQGPLRLGGVANGSVLRPVPGMRQVALDVDVQGAEGEVWWMLDGRVASHGAAGHPFNLVLAHDGRYTLTVMDTHGRHDSVVFEIAGVTP
ncbi:penicillin-binding protein 1C [Achromobacter sp. UBA5777]|uniref:penicillin-binding protein 1C n=1 Tax=Achromobacter sp. UBA5777 TaxID=1945913 RepID=UPI0025BB9FD1|nr:penicillin-binding protein 1C [Achromobacter sp. UBA5777]